MKKFIYSLLVGVTILAVSCSDFTDVQPKGKNLLSTTDELEMLLNQPFTLRDNDLCTLCGDFIYALSDVPTILSQPNKTRQSILFAWDEANIDKFAELTNSDGLYTTAYGIIGKIANPVLYRVNDAVGSDKAKKQLKGEALVLRAYYHYLLINKFAKAYNPTTANNDPGLPYVTEDWDIIVPTEKVSIKEFYDNIINDLDLAIELDALPAQAVNRMRMNKASAYAVKALALMDMQKFDEAAVAARAALDINGVVNNYNEMLGTHKGLILGNEYPIIVRPNLKCEEDIFFTQGLEFYRSITPAAWDRFEPGHASKEKMLIDRMFYDYTQGMGTMITGLDYTMTYDLASGWNMSGVKTTQMYLIIAESEIRKNNFNNGMKALDAIRKNRIDPSLYEPLEGKVNNMADAIMNLKRTAHGENIYTLHSFINYKRWNLFPDYKETFSRVIAGKAYQITPESKMWVFPLPMNAISLNPNLLPQNYSL